MVALVVALVGFNALIARAAPGYDNSAEKLYTLSDESKALIRQIPADRPVYIQAYYSPEVPREYVVAKANLLGLLRELRRAGGRQGPAQPGRDRAYSNAAREAQKRFGIEPKRVVSTEVAPSSRPDEIFLGVAFTSGLEEVVVPFFDPGLPTEYELTRSIRVVSKSGRKKVGILAPTPRCSAGSTSGRWARRQEWPFVTELKKQYEVSSVALDAPIPGNLDVLLVAQPSSLTQKQIDALTDLRPPGAPDPAVPRPACRCSTRRWPPRSPR